MVGIVVVSHSHDLARGLADLAGQVAGEAVPVEHAGGDTGGGLGTSEDRVLEALKRADQGSGVIVLGDLGSAFLTVRHVLTHRNGNPVRVVDAPLVEGAVAAAVAASAGYSLEDVAQAAEETRGASKL